MPCPDATGVCSVPADGACTVPKTEGVIPPLIITQLIKNVTSATIQWDTTTSYPDQVVRCFDKLVDGGSYEDRVFVSRDSGEFTTRDIYPGLSDIFISLRPETDTEYGTDQIFKTNLGDQSVTHLGILVTYNGQEVIYND